MLDATTLATSGPMAAAALALLFGYCCMPSVQEHAVRHLPTPARVCPVIELPIIFMFLQGHRIYDWVFDTCKRFDGKPWRLKMPGRPVGVVVSSSREFEHILKTQFDVFVKGQETSELLYDVLGSGIFAVDGALWAHQRKTASHLFSVQMLRGTMEAEVRRQSEDLCARLRRMAQCHETVEIKRLLDVFTMDVFTKVGFGVDLGGLDGNDTSGFLDAFERSSAQVITRFRSPVWLWKFKRWLNIGSERQLKTDMAVINGLVTNIITRSMKEKKQTVTGESCRDLIQLFLSKEMVSEKGTAVMDPAIIRDMAINFIAAGRDTTSQSMAWFLLMMNRYPIVLARVRDELLSAVPELCTGNRTPTMAEVQDLPYFEAAIRESLRLNPTVPMTGRQAAQDTTLDDGTLIKAGTRVMLRIYALSRMASEWGDDAEQYNPDRWLDADSGKLRAVSQFQFPVFLGGPRTCLGMRFAYMEMKITLATLLSKMNLRTIRDPFAFTYRRSLTLAISGPMDVSISELIK